MPRPAPLESYVPGEIIADKYRLIQRLGEGGMGAVWVAKNLALDVQVAIKLLRTDVDAEGGDERLLTEARATARLKHPNIVRVFDFGRTRRNDPFIVMELLQGESLGDVLDREGRLAATFAVQLLLPCADALIAAHAKGIVHRDLKPDNVYLADSDGRMLPKVVDFGIAKFQLETREHKLTQAGTVLGSPDYMSPEQARGVEDIDHRADIWAFCVVLYECITGRVPFENANYNALLRHIIEDEIPSTLDFAAGDAELWRILQRGFEKQRGARYQSIRELGEELAGWLMMHGITEDVCGHSLRAAWLDPPISNTEGFLRASLPPGRASQPSLSSFARAAMPSAASSGRFAQVAPDAAVHPSVRPSAHPSAPAPPPEPPVDFGAGKRKTLLFGGLALVALAVLGATTALLLSNRGEAPPANAPPSLQPAPAVAPREIAPLASAAPAAPAEPPPSAEPAVGEEKAVPAHTAVVTQPPARGAAPAAAPRPTAAPSAAPSAPKKKTQYEDLGF